MIRWTAHLKDPEDKIELENAVRSARPVLELLAKMVEDQTSQLASTELDPKAFDNPNWAYKQAYKNGYRCSLKFLSGLLRDLDQQKQGNK